MLPVNTCAKLRGRVKCTVLKRSEVKSAYRLRLNDIEMTNLARKRERERENRDCISMQSLDNDKFYSGGGDGGDRICPPLAVQ